MPIGVVFGVYGALGWRRYVSVLQPFAGYLGWALDFFWAGALREGFNICFSGFFGSTDKIFILGD